MTTISKITQRYLREWADFQPVSATAMGISGHEGQVADLSARRIESHLQCLHVLNSELKKLPRSGMSARQALEADLLEGDLRLRIFEWEKERRYQSDPTNYVGELIYGLWYLLLRVKSPTLRVEAALARLRQSHSVLDAAVRNLKNPPRLWTQIALEEAQGYLIFLKDVQRELRRLAPSRRGEVDQAVSEGAKVGHDLVKFFRGLLRRSKGHFACGPRHFDFLLKNYHRYSQSAGQLEQIAREQMKEICEALQLEAQQIRPGEPWPKVVARLKQDHPNAKKILASYQSETRRLRRFILAKGLASIPSDESLKIIETPVFTRNTIPYAAYVDPPMFGQENRGTFFVTPIPAQGKGKTQALLEHNFGAMQVTALHEGYPGHHLQFAKQFHAKGTMMKLSMVSSFYEGWALYCEEMMYEVGYYDRATRLMQLKDKLWRACRVVVDVGMHTRKMSDAAAVKFLAKEAQMSEASARADVNWYTQRPTVPQSYLTGMLQIKKLREDCKAKWGKRFTLKKFHDDFLQFGAIPISLVRKMLLGR